MSGLVFVDITAAYATGTGRRPVPAAAILDIKRDEFRPLPDDCGHVLLDLNDVREAAGVAGLLTVPQGFFAADERRRETEVDYGCTPEEAAMVLTDRQVAMLHAANLGMLVQDGQIPALREVVHETDLYTVIALGLLKLVQGPPPRWCLTPRGAAALASERWRSAATAWPEPFQDDEAAGPAASTTDAPIEFLCRQADYDDDSPDVYKLGPWHRVTAADIEAAAVAFSRTLHGDGGAEPVSLPLPGLEDVAEQGEAPAFVVLVRGPEREAVFVGDGGQVGEANGWDRGGPLLCPRHCLECTEDHHLCDVLSDTAEGDPDHPAAKRGVGGWLQCKHCDAWWDYDFGEGIGETILDVLNDLGAEIEPWQEA